MAVDNLGITEKEDLQIEALSLGGTPEEVASLSRQPIGGIPQKFSTQSEFDPDFEQSLPSQSEFQEVLPRKSAREAARESLNASLANSQDIMADYMSAYSQLTSTGTSSTLEAIQSSVDDNKKRELAGFIQDAAQEGDVEGTEALLQASPKLLEEETDLHVAGLTNAAESFTEASREVPRVEEHRREFLKTLLEGREQKKKWNQIIDAGVRDLDPVGDATGAASFLADIAESTLLGEQALSLSKVARDILGERYLFETGTMLRDLSRKVRNLPVEEQEGEVKRIVDSFIEHSGVVKDNDVVRVFALEQFREFLHTPGGDREFERYFANVVGYMDIAGLGEAGRLLGKLGKVLKSTSGLSKLNTVTGDLQRANPDLDAVLGATALQVDGAAEKLGTTKAEALIRSTPGSTFDEGIILEGAPNSLVEKIKKIQTKAEEARVFTDNTFLYSNEAYRVKQTKVMDVLANDEIQAVSKPSYSSVRRDPDGNNLKVSAVYGDETDLPLTFAKANKIKELLGKGFAEEGVTGANPTILTRDTVSGTWEPLDGSSVSIFENNEYLVKVDFKSKMTHQDIVPGQLLGEGTTKGVGNVVGTKFAGAFINPQSYIDNSVIGAARVAEDSKGLKSHQLRSIAKSFLNLNFFGKKRVANLLEIGEKDQKVLRYSELEGRYSLKEIEAYYSARYLNDTVYNIKNAEMKAKLDAEGYRGLTIDLGDGNTFQNAMKVVDDVEVLRDTKVILDPYTGNKIPVDQVTLNSLRESGVTVGKLLRKNDRGAESFSFVAVSDADTHALPKNVYPYKEGYNFRINNNPYFIDSTANKVIDGVATRKASTVGVANSARQARETVENLKRQFPDDDFSFRFDRNISPGRSVFDQDSDALDGSGLQYWFSKRGDRLTDIDGKLSTVEDPVAAMNRMISATANVGTHGEMLETLVATHKAKYGKLKVDDQDLWSWDQNKRDWHFNKNLAKTSNDPGVTAAVNEFEYLETLKFMPTELDIRWGRLLEGIDAMMGSAPNIMSRASSAVVKKAIKVTPDRVARGTAFAMTIPLRPVRHLLLQSTTGLSLMGINPAITVKSFRDTSLMMMSLSTWQNPTLWKSTLKSAKLFGHSEKEWTDIFTAFRKSGKAYSIDSNVAIGEANFSWSRSMPDTVAGAVGQAALNVIKSPVTVGKAVGFDTGELANQSLTWLFALKQWQKANPGKAFTSQTVLDEITSTGRNLSVDMTKTDAFSYQKGLFASATQFMSINHKMALNILGKNPLIQGNPLDIRTVRGRYIAGMLAMYGTAGLGLQQFYDSWSKSLDVEIPSTIDDVLYGGFTTAIMNTSLDLAFGEEIGTNRTAFADSFSPASGVSTFAYDLTEQFIEGNFVEAFLGASGPTFGNIKEAAQFTTDMWGRDDLDTPLKVIKSFQMATREFGGFSDYYKLNLAISYNEKMNTLNLFGSNGRPSMEANSWGEIWSKALLGLNTRGEKELFEKHLKMYQDVRDSGKLKEGFISKDAKHLSRYFYDEWGKSHNFIDFAEKTKAIAFSLHKGDKSYGLAVWNEAKKNFSVDPRFPEFVASIAKEYAIADKDAPLREMINAARNSDGMTDSDKDKLIKAIEALQTSSENSRRLINENF